MTTGQATGALRVALVPWVPAIRAKILGSKPMAGSRASKGLSPIAQMKGSGSLETRSGDAFGAGKGQDDQNDLEGMTSAQKGRWSGLGGARSDSGGNTGPEGQGQRQHQTTP